MVPPSAPIYDRPDYFCEPSRAHFTEDWIPKCRSYMGSRLPPLLLGGFDHPHGDKQLLEIGPGIGQLTHQLVAWGWRVDCCEMGHWASRYLHEAYPTVTVYRADWMQWQSPCQYDAITGNHVLEHFVDASAALEKMVASLAPSSKLYLELPAQLFDDGVSNEKAWPGGLHNHDHWWHFSERTLRIWFENVGLEGIAFANTIREHEDNKLMDYHVVAVKPA
jgi:2-polyprenyl-3-methyl-5-hydroxy-6-metoxy-1,4-benzoquinol methylase